MGRFIGRRPDETPRIARRVATHLNPGEQVLAGIYLQRPGTRSAAMGGGSSAAVTGAIGGHAFGVAGEDDHDRRRLGSWIEQCAALGVDEPAAKRTIYAALVVTDARALVVRRSSLTRRLGELVLASPIDAAAVEVPRGGSELTLLVGGSPLRFELPQEHRFLPDVYRELPRLVADARAASA